MGRRGFTLVELLIVVAIIGVLSTVGVPTYRRMIAKAKQAEAKALLGSVHRVEAAFFSEFGVYGNNLTAIGFDIDGATEFVAATWARQIGNYSIGFPVGGSGAVGCLPTPGLKPSTPEAVVKISKTYPAYFGDYVVVYLAQASIPDLYCEAASVADDGSIYLATASGYLGRLENPGGKPALYDTWAIGHNRVLSQLNSGLD